MRATLVRMAKRARETVGKSEAVSKGTDVVVIERTVPESGALRDSNDSIASTIGRGVKAMRFDPTMLRLTVENSAHLAPNIDAYQTNICGFGHVLEPLVNWDDPASFERVRESMWIERFVATPGDESDPRAQAIASPPLPTDVEVQQRIEQAKLEARLERVRLEAFFASCVAKVSFLYLRRQRRRDMERYGNAYWEVLRDAKGRIARFQRIPPATVRCTALDPRPVWVTERAPVGLFAWQSVEQPTFFRRYAQLVSGRASWFKELGDTRIISRQTGEHYASMKVWESKRAKGEIAKLDVPATEIIHFTVGDADDGYGVPRWIGNLAGVMGASEASEQSLDYLKNNCVPAGMIAVDGGGFGDEDVKKLETTLRAGFKGRNSKRILLMQARVDPTDAHGRVPTVKFVSFQDAKQQDAGFLEYDEREADKTGGMFRNPRLMRGDSRDMNRATAKSALDMAEEQVYRPERDDEDAWINGTLMPRLGARYHKFKSIGVQNSDPEVVTVNVERSTRAGAITPNEARKVLAPVLGIELPPVSAPWGDVPLAVSVGPRGGFRGPTGAPQQGSLEGDADGEPQSFVFDSGRFDEASARAFVEQQGHAVLSVETARWIRCIIRPADDFDPQSFRVLPLGEDTGVAMVVGTVRAVGQIPGQAQPALPGSDESPAETPVVLTMNAGDEPELMPPAPIRAAKDGQREMPIEPAVSPAGQDASSSVVEEAQELTSALDGAQIAEMRATIIAVADGRIPRATGVQILASAFPFDYEQAEQIMGDVGQGFSAPRPEPPVPVASVAPEPALAPVSAPEPGADDSEDGPELAAVLEAPTVVVRRSRQKCVGDARLTRRADVEREVAPPSVALDRLDGDQTRAATEVLRQVALGEIPRTAGLQLLGTLGLSTERSNEIMGDVGMPSAPAKKE